ncbi:GNAT family N-acetyltransferase [Fluoribacter gormanii]|uniref:Acetyltransferase involved in cellulose biosynthesis, CelD/BcsL family n=1 Tax=Fluoribacter gormanii TaxID=464 RepID=A0A377GN76_9GAMM|nr:GNAT family N-acetyltransferase [Fluoribacter gormanii]KTD04744.1 hypothetical protein Lgor_0826 [Fluoribacter gormanii]MCW8445380.1 GNAT family N-acetyltransferase [Fluoribacter gormanii]SIR15196.1 Acetyltransferase involved in cellulose biosynthesis, CelD/BcsL family [Fluoribacter gormanii]STO26256.1 Protein involved in cellulose biosynthesis (CelD) [Fluoribacter gormanii]
MIEIIHDLEELKFLASSWNELAKRFKNPLLLNEWFAACAATYQPEQLQIIVSKSSKGIDAIAPLVLVKNHGIKRLELLGSFLYEPSGLIYRNEKTLQELIEFIIKLKVPIILTGLRSDSLEVSTLLKMNKKGCFVLKRDGFLSPVLSINTSWNLFQTNLSSTKKYNLRRKRKNAEAQVGKIEVEEITPSISKLPYYFNLFTQIEASGWKGRNGTAILCDSRMQKFLSLYCEEKAKQGALKFFFLKINHKIAGALLRIKDFNRLWSIKTAYNEAYAKYSPGVLLEYEAIRYSFEQGLEALEFLGQDDPWKNYWTNDKHQYLTIRIYPFTLMGQMSLGLDGFFFLMNKLFQRAKK